MFCFPFTAFNTGFLFLHYINKLIVNRLFTLLLELNK